jgi:polyhydroxyalkanoate synthesis regulator phasin
MKTKTKTRKVKKEPEVTSKWRNKLTVKELSYMLDEYVEVTESEISGLENEIVQLRKRVRQLERKVKYPPNPYDD